MWAWTLKHLFEEKFEGIRSRVNPEAAKIYFGGWTDVASVQTMSTYKGYVSIKWTSIGVQPIPIKIVAWFTCARWKSDWIIELSAVENAWRLSWEGISKYTRRIVFKVSGKYLNGNKLDPNAAQTHERNSFEKTVTEFAVKNERTKTENIDARTCDPWARECVCLCSKSTLSRLSRISNFN